MTKPREETPMFKLELIHGKTFFSNAIIIIITINK